MIYLHSNNNIAIITIIYTFNITMIYLYNNNDIAVIAMIYILII